MADIDPTLIYGAAAALLVAVGLGFLLGALADLRRRRLVLGRLDQALAAAPGGVRARSGRAVREEGRGTALGTLGDRVVRLENDRGELRQLMIAAGHFNPAHVGTFALIRLAATVAGGVGGWFGLSAVELPIPYPGPIGAFLGAAIAYLLAKRVLVRRANARRSRIRRELSAVLDVIGMTVESGLTVEQSLRWIAQLEGLDAPESQRVTRLLVRDLDSGMPWEDAIHRFAQRLAIVEAHDLAGVFIQSVTSGTDVKRPLKAFAAEFSDVRVQLARERIGRISTALSGIMVGFFLPVLLIVVGAPAFIKLIDGLSRINQ